MSERVAHPVDELAVFVVRNLGIVHVEALDRDLLLSLNEGVANVLVARTDR